MRARWKLALAALALLMLLGIGLGWLLGSRSGAAWLLAQTGRIDGVSVQAEVKGSLWSGLELSQVAVRWPGGELTGDRLQLAWRPLRLLRGQLVVDALHLGHLRMLRQPTGVAEVVRPDAAKPLWPRLPAWLLSAGGRIDSLTLAELAFGPADDETLKLTDLRGRLQLAGGELRGERLHLGLPCGTWDGSLRLDLRQQRLESDLLWRGAVFAADWDGVRTRVTLDANLTGPLRATLLAGEVPRAELQAQAQLASDGVDLRQLVIRRSGGPDRISGALRVAWAGGFLLSGQLQLQHLNLAAEAGWPTELSGSVDARLDAHGYRGTVDLTSARPGLERGALAGQVAGDWRGLQLKLQRGRWLGGGLSGTLQLGWHQGFSLRGELTGSDLDPAALVPELSARLNLRASGSLQVQDGVLSADWDARLERSQLQGRTLQGRVAGRWQDDDLQLEQLQLSGDGLQLQGSGRLAGGIAWQLQVADLGKVGQGWHGELHASGRLARRDGAWSGEVAGRAKTLQFRGLQAASGQLEGRLQPAGDLQLELTLAKLATPYGDLNSLQLEGDGTLAAHRLQLAATGPADSLSASFAGGWRQQQWQGALRALKLQSRLLGSWSLTQPAALQLGAQRLQVADLDLVGAAGGRLGLSGALGLSDARPLELQGAWDELPLALLTPWLGELRLDGTTSGSCRLQSASAAALSLHAELAAGSRWQWHDQQLELQPLKLQLDWDAQGLRLTGTAELGGGGDLLVEAHSGEPGHRGWPATGNWLAQWDRVPLEILNPWLPIGLQLGGEWLGELSGEWRGSAPPLLRGRSWLDDGKLAWQGADGLLRVPLKQAELGFHWNGSGLQSDLALQLADQGEIRGQGRLAAPASWPPRLTGTETLSASLDYRLDELGLVAALLPAVVDETHGALQGSLQLSGPLRQPQLAGDFALRKAGARLPVVGLQLSEIGVTGHFSDRQVVFDTLQLHSGEGTLHGKGRLQLEGWRPAAWSLELSGEQVLLANLAEFRLVASPQLQLSGTPGHYRVRGQVDIPELLLNELPKAGLVKPSDDVQVVGRAPETELFQPRNLDLELQVVLGKQVVVKARGLDARLAGQVTVLNNPRTSFSGRGEIRVAQGHYAAYGIKLPIEQGRAVFAGGPLTDPSLDVLAERTIGTASVSTGSSIPGTTAPGSNIDLPSPRTGGVVKAGVRITGTPRRPVINLVSEPSLPETDILSYIVLGRPLDAGGGETGGLMLAAGALLSQGDSALLQQKLKNRLGIDTLEVQSNGASSGVESSVITVGKYLTPELYLSYGRALFTPNNYAQLRYRFLPDWELESQLGTVSGADLFYRIEFR